MLTFFSYKADAEVLKESILWFFVQIYEIMLQHIIFYYIHIVIYIYIIQIRCVCACACVRVRVCVCVSSIGGQTAGPIMTKFGTYMRIDMGMVPTQKKMVPRMVRKGGLIGAILRSRYLSGGQRAIRAVTASR